MTTVKNFCLNLASAEEQANTVSEADLLVSKVIAQIEYIRPMIQCKRAFLWRMLECVPPPTLQKSKTLENSISKIDRDLRNRWQLFQKKYISDPENSILLEFRINEITRFVDVSDRCTLNSIWISFENPKISLAQFSATSDDGTKYIIKMSSNISTLINHLPIFKHSKKHRYHSYYDKDRNEFVAAMPIRCETEAGILLRNGIMSEKDYFSKDKNGKYFRFKNTLNNEYHGFEVFENEVPIPIKKILEE